MHVAKQKNSAFSTCTKREHTVTNNIHGILGLQTVRPTLHYNTTVHWYSDCTETYLQYTVVQYSMSYSTCCQHLHTVL